MNLLELVIIQACNYKCPDCPMAPWMYDVNDPLNALDNDIILKWVTEYIKPDEWYIEITGGEPGLYEGINDLIWSLKDKGYQGLIRTNGSLRIDGPSPFKRVAAWHSALEDVPKYYDMLCILERPDSEWELKEKYCRDSKIPYVVFPYKFFSTDNSQTRYTEPLGNKIFDKMVTVFASGALGGCYNAPDTGRRIQNMDPPILMPVCNVCSNCEALEIFMQKMGVSLSGFMDTAEIGMYVSYPLNDPDNPGMYWTKNGEHISDEEVHRRPSEVVHLTFKQMQENDLPHLRHRSGISVA